MGATTGKKADSKARILASAGRGFRGRGFGGLGVDGLAKEAGVTSGAFYSHFKSKAEAFREAVTAGMQDALAGVVRLRESGGADWRARFVDRYLAERCSCDIGDTCALQSLTGEVARADVDAREAYEVELRKIIDATAAGMTGATDADRRVEAIGLLAMLTGGVSIARAVHDPALRDEIAASVRVAAAAR